MRTSYNKPFLTVQQQVAKLIDNGLDIPDKDEAEKILREIGYYRLSGYWFIFREEDDPSQVTTRSGKRLEKRKSSFKEGTNFSTVRALYEFDEKLRDKVFEAIRTIEVSLRFEIGHSLGKTSAFAHCDPSCLSPEFTGMSGNRPRDLLHADWAKSKHAKWLTQVEKEETRSSDVFIDHFEENYGRPLPVWVVTEILTFGTLLELLSGMKQTNRSRIALIYRIVDSQFLGDGSSMANWMNHLRYIRNICAHHSRLWNRNMTTQLGTIPNGIPELVHLNQGKARSRVYGSIAVIAYLLEKIDPKNPWRLEIVQLCEEESLKNGFSLQSMGFPEHWGDLAIWGPTYRNSLEEKIGQRFLIESVETMQPQDLGRLLKEKENAKKRRDYLRYLRKQGHLIGVQTIETYEYPAFQIDKENRCVRETVAEINKQLFDRFSHTEDAAWPALKWWLTPLAGSEATPKILLEQGKLSQEKIEECLNSSEKE